MLFKDHGIAIIAFLARRLFRLAWSVLTGVACLHLMPQPKTGYQNRIELLQGTLDMLILKTLQLASDYERWGRMVASIEGIMSATRNEV